MRVLLAIVLAACSGGRSSTKPTSSSQDVNCRPPANEPADAAASCKARGCTYGEALLCSGTPIAKHEEPKPCACVCQADIDQCAKAQ